MNFKLNIEVNEILRETQIWMKFNKLSIFLIIIIFFK